MEKQKLESTKHFEGGEYTHRLKDGDKVLGQAVVKRDVTADMIESVIVSAFEGGITYWVVRAHDKLEDGSTLREGKPKSMAFSEWCTELIFEGKAVGLVTEGGELAEEEIHYFNLEKLIKGFELFWAKHQPYNFDGDADCGDADNLIQYAIFGKLVYG